MALKVNLGFVFMFKKDRYETIFNLKNSPTFVGLVGILSIHNTEPDIKDQNL